MVLKLFLILFVSSIANASVYNPGYYGQKDFDVFYGANDLLFSTDPFYGHIIFEDSQVQNNYINSLFLQNLNEYQTFFNQQLRNSLTCPNWEISRMYDYLRYANRVIAISYIYEAIRLQNQTAIRLGINNKCAYDWKKVFEKCKTQTQDMHIFVQSAKHILEDEKKYNVDMSHSIKAYRNDWERQYNEGNFKDISQYKVHQICKRKNCTSRIDYEKAMDFMQKGCDQDKELLLNICSEEDYLYGMSEIQEIYPLLVNSDILTYFDNNRNASGCLRRFTKQMKSREVVHSSLNTIFPIVYQTLGVDKGRIIQGELFSAGSLKQFIEKGLTEIYKEKKEKVKTSVVAQVKKENKILPQEDKVEFIDRVIKKKLKTQKKKIVKKIKEKKKIFKSNFLIAVEVQQQMDMDIVDVDMLKFKYDFLFSIELKNMLDQNLSSYTTRKGLGQMKKFDKLGSPEGPVPLMFLKYLIESDKHQSLYNILGILGNKFYVTNDIDKHANTDYDFIELRNDETTSNQWQISILKIPVKAEESASLSPKS